MGLAKCCVFVAACLSLAEAKFYRPLQHHAGLGHHQNQGRPTSRHHGRCAYVVEKTVTFTVQDGAAPYVKAEYNKCSWAQKCPTLLYRLLYKPLYKVAHKTVTELEWRCCPGFSGYGCVEAHPVYQHHVNMMPPFKGPPMKSPPMFKGPMFKGPSNSKAGPWSRPKGPPTGSFNPYTMHHFGPPRASPYGDTSFEPYHSEPEPMPEHQELPHQEPHLQEPHLQEPHLQEPHLQEPHLQEPHLQEPHLQEPHLQEPHLQEPHLQEREHELEHGLDQGPPEHLPEENPPALPGAEGPEGGPAALDNEAEERILRMEEDVQRLNRGLETLRGTVNGLEASLRASLREDANRMLSALLSAAPSPISAPAVSSSLSAVGFGEIPGGGPELEGLDGRHVFPGLPELKVKVEELRTALKTKTAELQELKATVLRHDGALTKMAGERPPDSPGGSEGSSQTSLERLIEAKLSQARTEILGGFEVRVETAEGRCEEKVGDVRRQCQREQGEQQGQMADALEDSNADLRRELADVKTQMRGLKASESCCDRTEGLAARVRMLETSVAGLNQSQGHLRVELGGHKDHIEGILEGRLGYVESKLNLTGETGNESRRSDQGEAGRGLEARMEAQLRALEERLLLALDELGNATAPPLLEGHTVPTLETELESIRERLEVDVDRVQRQISSLELLCASSCSSPQNPPGVQRDAAVDASETRDIKEALDAQDGRLDTLNVTLQHLRRHMAALEQNQVDYPIRGELTVLKFNIRSVNHTLRGVRDSLGSVVHRVGQANSSWQEREARLAQQIKGVVQLVGHQASMLGAGERRLTRLKGELQEMKKRLAHAVQGCRSTAIGVKKEVTEVGGRVASVEDRCKGLNHLAEDLERIREELEGQSSGLLQQVNGTLSIHTQQLSELRDGLRNCTSARPPPPPPPPPPQSLELEEEQGRGDTFSLN